MSISSAKGGTPCRNTHETSSVEFARSVLYGIITARVVVEFISQKFRLLKFGLAAF